MRGIPLGVALVAAALYLLRLGGAPFIDPPEGFHAELAQLATQVGGVGVDDLAGENLVADEDDAGRLRHGGANFTTPSTPMLDLTA